MALNTSNLGEHAHFARLDAALSRWRGGYFTADEKPDDRPRLPEPSPPPERKPAPPPPAEPSRETELPQVAPGAAYP